MTDDRAPQALPDLEATLRAWGAFFCVQFADPLAGRRGGAWLPLADLADPRVLDARVARVRRALAGAPGAAGPAGAAGTADDAGVPERVAASVTQLGIVARLLAPVIALAVLDRDADELLTGSGWWQDELGGPFPLVLRDQPPPVCDTIGGLSGSVVETVTEATSRRFRVSPAVVWGNVASGAHSAMQLIVAVAPDRATRAAQVVRQLLDDPRIPAGERGGVLPFRRTSCCLMYRLNSDRAPVCGDCVLAGQSVGASGTAPNSQALQ